MPLQFTASADQRAAVIIPSQLTALRRKERLRELYALESEEVDQAELAVKLAEKTGLDHDTTLALLADLASEPASLRTGK